jgi:hypothetical protein
MDIDSVLENEAKDGIKKKEYDLSLQDRWNNQKKKIKSFFDWKKLPLDFLFYAILLIGAILMYTSIYTFTQNIFVAFLSIFFSEMGIISWKLLVERSKNTVRQMEIARWMRDYHIYISVSLLVSNMVLESIEYIGKTLGFHVEGAFFIVLLLIAITAFLDLVNYINFQDADRELSNKREYQTKQEEFKASVTKKQLETEQKIDEIESKAMLEFYESHAPKIAMIEGRVKAAKQIRDAYEKMGIKPDEVEALIQLAKNLGNDIETSDKPIENKPINVPVIKTPRPYHRREKPENPTIPPLAK